MLVGLISDPQHGGPCPGNANTTVGSLVVGKEQVDRHWSDPLPVGCQPTPGLSSQDFPLSAPQVHEIEPKATSMRVTSRLRLYFMDLRRGKWEVLGEIGRAHV